jgi:hypothetical protein
MESLATASARGGPCRRGRAWASAHGLVCPRANRVQTRLTAA